MDINILFATGFAKEMHLALAEKAKNLFQDDIFIEYSPGFKTSLKNYVMGKGVVDSGYTKENALIIKEIEATILAQAEIFYSKLGYTKNDTVEFKITNLWLNEMVSGSYHERHTHYGNVISGCFYVDVPPGSGGVMFYGPLSRIDKANLDVKEYTVFNSGTWTIVPEAGNMLMWESYLQHEVPTSEFIGKRRSIAFDVSLDIKE